MALAAAPTPYSTPRTSSTGMPASFLLEFIERDPEVSAADRAFWAVTLAPSIARSKRSERGDTAQPAPATAR